MPFDTDLAHLERDQVAQRLFFLAQCITQIAYQQASFRGGHHLPGFKGFLGSLSHLVVCITGGLDDLGYRFACRGVIGDQFITVWIFDPAIGSGAGSWINLLY